MEKKKIIIITSIVIALVLIACGVGYFLLKDKNEKQLEEINSKFLVRELQNKNYKYETNLLNESNYLKFAKFNTQDSVSLISYNIEISDNKLVFKAKKESGLENIEHPFQEEKPIQISVNKGCAGPYAFYVLTDVKNIYAYENSSDEGINEINLEKLVLKKNVSDIKDNLSLITLYPYVGAGCSVKDKTFLWNGTEIYNVDGTKSEFNPTLMHYLSDSAILISEETEILDQSKKDIKKDIIYTAYLEEKNDLKEMIAIDYNGNIYTITAEELKNQMKDNQVILTKDKLKVKYIYQDNIGTHFVLNDTKELDIDSYQTFYNIYEQLIQSK